MFGLAFQQKCNQRILDGLVMHSRLSCRRVNGFEFIVVDEKHSVMRQKFRSQLLVEADEYGTVEF